MGTKEPATIFTVGHSNVSSDVFIGLLQQHGITAVADVRSHPYSRYLPHFSRPALKTALRESGIRYVFLGDELGARPENPACYENGKAVYDRIAETPQFQAGIARLHSGSQSSRIAIMCAEKEPLVCHRTILVCRHLRRPSLAIQHIRADGNLESHEHLEQRLLAEHGLQQGSLFEPRTQAQLLDLAYDQQGERIAFTKAENWDDEFIAAS